MSTIEVNYNYIINIDVDCIHVMDIVDISIEQF